MAHQQQPAAYSFGNNQPRNDHPKPNPNRGNTASSANASINTSSNNEFLNIYQLAIQNRKINFDNLNSIKSYKIHNEQEYHMVLLLSQRLTEEMTKFRLTKTPKPILNSLERSQIDE